MGDGQERLSRKGSVVGLFSLEGIIKTQVRASSGGGGRSEAITPAQRKVSRGC